MAVRVNRRLLREDSRSLASIKTQQPNHCKVSASCGSSVMSVTRHNPQPPSPVRGRPFEKGNGGRRPGSKNRTTLVAEALLKGEEDELVRKGIELAKAGDVQMLKFLLDRILPKERSVRVDLPIVDRSSDAVDALAAVINAVGTGQIAPSEAAALASLVAAYARIINVAEIEERLQNIEKGLRDLREQGWIKDYGTELGKARSYSPPR